MSLNSTTSSSSNHWQVIVSAVLTRIITTNKCMYNSLSSTLLSSPFACFHSSYPPSISLFEYISRIMQFSNCSESCLILLMIYLDKLMSQKRLTLTELNIHRLVVTGLMVASKFHDDLFYNNAYYAKIGGVNLKEMNALELAFLNLMEYSLYVPLDLYSKYQNELTISSSITLSSINLHSALNYPMPTLMPRPTPAPMVAVGSNSLAFSQPHGNLMIFNNDFNHCMNDVATEEMKYDLNSLINANSNCLPIRQPFYMISSYDGMMNPYNSLPYDNTQKMSYNLMNSCFPPPPPPHYLAQNNYLIPSNLDKELINHNFLNNNLKYVYEETKYDWNSTSQNQLNSQLSHSYYGSNSSINQNTNYNNKGWSVF